MKYIYIIFCVAFLIYMIWPTPTNISDFKALPSSVKSTLEGDTIQIPNVSAYFSNNFRNFVVPFYIANYQKKSLLPFPPLRLNHPPEYSWKVIKVNTDSTYLEELIYPLRDSLFVNGFEPFYEDGSAKFWGSVKFEIGKGYFTKTTLRFYPSSLIVRLLVWLGIISSILMLYKLGRKII